jgi:hypothetical protein
MFTSDMFCEVLIREKKKYFFLELRNNEELMIGKLAIAEIWYFWVFYFIWIQSKCLISRITGKLIHCSKLSVFFFWGGGAYEKESFFFLFLQCLHFINPKPGYAFLILD